MTVVISICVAVTFGVSVFLLLSRELKGIAMGVFLIGHAANLCIIGMSGSPVKPAPDHGEMVEYVTELKAPPLLTSHEAMPDPLTNMVDPLPQALILTAIVIGFGVMGILLALIIVTGQKTGMLETDELAKTSDPPNAAELL